MRSVSLQEALGVHRDDTVAFVGAGGKTSAVRRLADELYAQRHRVLVLSTTKIEAQRGAIDTLLCPTLSLAREAAAMRRAGDRPLLLATEKLPTRLRGVPPEWVGPLAERADVVLVQADGAARRPFKAPAAHEPVIPPTATIVVAVAGIDAIGRPIDERHVHRPERVAALAGVEIGTPLTVELAARVLLHPQGGFRGVPRSARRAILLNKADDPPALATADSLATLLRAQDNIRVVVTALRSQPPVVHTVR
jgi:probable selenium-dependent hydroxylase accessory protein YqeC